MGLHSSMSPEAIARRIERDQTTGAPLSEEVAARVAEDTAKGLEQLAEWKRSREPKGLPVDAVVEALWEVANMTPEEEARLNAIILEEEAQALAAKWEAAELGQHAGDES